MLGTDIITKKRVRQKKVKVLNRVVQKYNKYIRQTDTQIQKMYNFKESFLKVFSNEVDKKFQK